MPVPLEFWQLGGQKATQWCHEGKDHHKKNGPCQFHFGIDQKDTENDGNWNFMNDDAIQNGIVVMDGYSLHQGMDGQAQK